MGYKDTKKNSFWYIGTGGYVLVVIIGGCRYDVHCTYRKGWIFDALCSVCG